MCYSLFCLSFVLLFCSRCVRHLTSQLRSPLIQTYHMFPKLTHNLYETRVTCHSTMTTERGSSSSIAPSIATTHSGLTDSRRRTARTRVTRRRHHTRRLFFLFQILATLHGLVFCLPTRRCWVPLLLSVCVSLSLHTGQLEYHLVCSKHNPQ